MSTHPTKRLTAPDGEPADIDVMLVPLIEALWEAGYDTIGCCQDLGESIAKSSPRQSACWKGYVLLEMPVRDACRLAESVSGHPKFRDRMHWAADGAWEMSSPLVPLGDEIVQLPWVQIHFPAGQLSDLLDAISQGRRLAVRPD